MGATAAAGAVSSTSAPAHAGGEELRDLSEVSSENGVLDTALDMVTKPVELGGRQLRPQRTSQRRSPSICAWWRS